MSNRLDPIDLQFIINSAEFQAELERIRTDTRRTIREIEADAQRTGKALDRLSQTLAGVFSISAAKSFVTELLHVRGEFQQIENSLETMLRSSTKAIALMEEWKGLTLRSPFRLSEIAASGKQLLAYGIDVQNVTHDIEMLANIASGVSQPISEIAYLYGTLRTQGRAYSRDILQFTNRGINLLPLLSKQLGIAQKDVMAFVEAGKVGFTDVEQAFISMTSEGGQFYNLIGKQAETLTGQINRLKHEWELMLNEIGEDNEGFLSGVIGTAATVVEHYDTVLDIMGVLIATYGAYRAAVIVTTAIEAARATSLVRLNAVQLLAEAGAVALRRAQLALNAAVSANPYVIGAAALAGLVTYMALAADNTDNLTSSKKIEKDIIESVTSSVETQRLKLQELLKTAKDENASKASRLKALKDINAISPEYLGNLNLENINTKAATDAVDEYIKALRRLSMEKAINDKRTDLMSKIVDIQVRSSGDFSVFDQLAAGAKSLLPSNWHRSSADILLQTEELKGYYEALDALAKMQKEALEETAIEEEIAQKRTLKFLDERIKELKEEQSAQSDSKAVFEKYQKQIDALEAEKTRITGKLSKENKKIADEQKKMLQTIAEAEEEAFRKGLARNEEEIKANKDKYEKMRREAKEAGLGAGVLERIDRIEERTTGDIRYRQETEKFKIELDRQKELFADYEEYKNKLSVEAANKRFEGEKANYDSYSSYVQSEIDKLNSATSGREKTGVEQERLKVLSDLLKAALNDEAKQRDQYYIEAFEAAASLEQELLTIKKKYAKLAADLGDPNNPELKRQRDEEILAAEDQAFKRTAIFRKLNNDILDLTADQIRQEIQLLNKALGNDLLSPETYAAVQSKITDLTNVIGSRPSTNRTFWDVIMGKGFSERENSIKAQLNLIEESISKEKLSADEIIRQTEEATRLKQQLKEIATQKWEVLSSRLQEIGQSFNEIANALPDTNAGLKDTLLTLGQIVQVGSDASGSVGSFMSGDIIGGITKGIKAIAGVVNIFKAGKESAKQARKEVEAYYNALKTGEYEYAKLLRERKRDHEDINDLTRTELALRRQLLQTQTGAALGEYNRLLAQIQANGQQITGVTTEKYGGFLGIGRKTRSVQQTAGVRGATYEELEQMYTEGRLTDDTRKWFEQLQKVKGEVDDINQLLKDIDDLEISKFTGGLTADSIASTIKDGFNSGKKHIIDFADDAESILKNALLSSLSYTVLEEPLKELVKQFQKDADGGLSKDGIERFKNGFNSIVESGLDALSEIEKATGIKFNGDSSKTSPMAGAIQQISYDQANALEGLIRSDYDLSKRHYLFIEKSTSQQLAATLEIVRSNAAIEDNTANAVTKLEEAVTELKTISKNTKPQMTGRDGGYG
ncbi:tape measure protein [Olivibacter sp. 47]|uniref:tape measure protein n=1 Tax=Olivibacter sp. 47 TaxID=3056486 RepID=UPI0025A433E1|nr:tape measure protein [Olivibacter sp. 47]MDM8176842.1 tape measure protein [Olivibacter sp. 47]